MGDHLPITALDKKPLWDHCGIVAAYSSQDINFFQTGLRGLQVLQTRGYDGAGFWAQDKAGRIFQYKGVGMINEVFAPEITQLYRRTPANIWVYQVRYGTSGSFSSANVQPLTAVHQSSGQPFVVAHNGQFSADPGAPPTDASDTVIFTRELAESNGQNWDDRIVKVLSRKRGAWSLVVGTPSGLYIARDSYGFRPLVYGHVFDKRTGQYIWIVASETSSLETVGVEDYLELVPGTVAKITGDGLHILAKINTRKFATCIFENIYIQHGAGKALLPRTNPRKIMLSPTVDEVRRRSGKILAREAPLTKYDVDMVIGVPGTGIEGGMYYSRALNLPYFQAITDKSSSLVEQRTFMTARIDSIYQKVLDHFSFDEQALKGRKVVLVDDSIVRGNITKGLVHLLKQEYQVTAVHLRILCPPIDKSCHLGVNTRTQTELIAAQFHNDVERIRQEVGADSLSYLSAGGLKEALTGDAKAKGFCLGCMAGYQYPVDQFGRPAGAAKKTVIQEEKIAPALPIRLMGNA